MSCQIHCPVHCGLLPERVGPLESPYPELLLSNYVVPLDSQIPAIQNTIQAAEDRISGIDDEIMRLQTMISRLKRQRSEVLDIADIHRGAVSTMRRFPSEILTEIFSHCVQEDALSPFNPSNRHPWLITRVCSRWRAAALSSPTLWCHLVVVPLHDTIKESSLVPLLSLQLERAGQAPLSVHLRSRRSYTSNVLDVLLTASERWENIILDLTPSDFHHLHTFVGHLPVMKKLEIRNAPQDCPDNIFMSLPALEDLGLCNIIPPARFNLPWTQLRKCTMDNCWSLDVLRILSLASSATQFVISNGWRLGDELATSNTNCSARSLTFDDCDNTFVEYVLAPLIAPALDELIIELPDARDDEDLFQPSITQEIMSFLTRSECTITHLSLGGLALSEDMFTEILQITHKVVHLELALSGSALSDFGVQALTIGSSRGLVPDLRLLYLEGIWRSDWEPLYIMLQSRCPGLQTMHFRYCAGDVLSKKNVNALQVVGLEVSFLT